MDWLTIFLAIAFVVFLFTLQFSSQQVPVGMNCRGETLSVTQRPVGFCLVVAVVIAALATMLVCRS